MFKVVRTKMILLYVVCCLAITGCADKDLERAASALRDTAQAVDVLQTTIIQANAAQLVSDEATRSILETTVRVNKAGLEAVAITRDLNELNPAVRGQLLNIVKPIMDSVSRAINEDLVKIEDASTRSRVQLLLLTIQTSLNTVQLSAALRS